MAVAESEYWWLASHRQKSHVVEHPQRRWQTNSTRSDISHCQQSTMPTDPSIFSVIWTHP